MTLTSILIQNMDVTCNDGVIEPGSTEAASKVPVLYQNEPNPFSEETKIRFWLPQTEQVSITVHDITGRAVKQIGGLYEQGMNEILIRKAEIGGYGLYYYTLSTSRFVDTKPMILAE